MAVALFHQLMQHVRSAVRPRLRQRIEQALERTLLNPLSHGGHVAALQQLYDRHEGELALWRDLAGIGHELLRMPDESAQRLGCTWLGCYPSVETTATLSTLLDNEDASVAVRDHAAWTLGFRQVQQRSSRTFWTAETVALADAALARAWRRGDASKLKSLPEASRHADLSLVLCERFSVEPERVVAAVDCFCSDELARRLLPYLPKVASQFAPRLIRCLAATLGAEAVTPLLAYAEEAPLAEQLEARFAALSLGSERAGAILHDYVASLAFKTMIAGRLQWHEQHHGAFPTVTALRIARTSATLAVDARATQAIAACAGLQQVASHDMLNETVYWSFWRHLAWLSQDAKTIVAAVDAHPHSLREAPYLGAPYVQALVDLGHCQRASTVARQHALQREGVTALARASRPFMALTLATEVAHHSLESAAAQALALFLCGRPDLAERSLRQVVPSDDRNHSYERFPDEEALFWANLAPEDRPVARLALSFDVARLLGWLRPLPAIAEPDTIDFSAVQHFERQLTQTLAGKSIFLAGESDWREPARASLAEHGLREVSAPFANTDYYCRVGPVDPREIARFTSQGLQPLPLTSLLPNLSQETSMSKVTPPLPLRAAFSCPIVRQNEPEHLYQTVRLLAQVTFDHLVRHPRVAVPEPSSVPLVNDNSLLSAGHPKFDTLLQEQLIDAHRDEVLWFDIDLTAATPKVVLHTQPHGSEHEEFATIASSSLSAALATCVKMWLDKRGLPVPPTAMPTFSAAELLAAARTMQEISPAAAEGHIDPVLKAIGKMPLGTQVLRATVDDWGGELSVLYRHIIERDPENVETLRDMFFDRLHNKGDEGEDRSEIQRIIELAPNWGMPYLSMFGKQVGDDRSVCATGQSVVLMPSYAYSLDTYGLQLRKVGRHAEAYRQFDRSTESFSRFCKGHQNAMMSLASLGRYGEAWHDAEARWAVLGEWWNSGQHNKFDRDWLRGTMFLHAEAYFDVGRLPEAIELFDAALKECTDPGQHRLDTIKGWREDPALIARSYAREGYFRRDLGRVLKGFAKGGFQFGSDKRMFFESLRLAGQDEHAKIAFAQMRGGDRLREGFFSLAAAEMLVSEGKLGEALEELVTIQLRDAQADYEPRVQRVLRLAASRPISEWETVIQQWQSRGATRIAWLIARDAADYVPGAHASKAVTQVLGTRPVVQFDPGHLAALRAGVGEPVAAPIDAFFSDAKDADQAVAGWWGLVSSHSDHNAAVDSRLYVATQVTNRYLAATTEAPSPMAGAWRTIASEAWLSLRKSRVAQEAFRPVLEALEAVGRAADPWLFDTWLLRVERILDIEHRVGGHLDELTQGLEVVSDLIRGDERHIVEWNEADRLKGKQPAQALPLLERAVRRVGMGKAALEWSEAANLALPPADAMNVHWIASLLNANSATPWIHLVRGLLADGKGEDAYEALVRGIHPAGGKWLDEKLASLSSAWAKVVKDVPLDWSQASSQGMVALQQGAFDKAIRLFRFCAAYDAKNEMTLRNLGIAYARAGRAHEAVGAFTAASKDSGLRWAGQALVEAQHYAAALPVFDYAARFGLDPDGWKLFGTAAYYQEDDVLGVKAYDALHAAAGATFDANTLNIYAMVLNGAGEHMRAQKIAEQLLSVAKGDATYGPCGEFELAKALHGQGKNKEALPHIEAAVSKNALPDNAAEYNTVAERIRTGGAFVSKVTPPSLAAQAFTALLGSDAKEAKRLAGQAIEANKKDWAGWRALLAATSYRFEADADAPAADGLKVAEKLLQVSAGDASLEAVRARVMALEVREQHGFSIDTPPGLGSRVSDAQFDKAVGVKPVAAAPANAAAQAAAAFQAATMKAPAVGSDEDVVVFAGSKIEKLSQYVALTKGIQTGDMMGALQRAGLSMTDYATVATQWATKLASDQTLNQKFVARLMK